MRLKQRFLTSLTAYFRWDLYRRLLPYARPYRVVMALVAALEVIYTLLGLLEPWFTKLLIDNGLGRQPVPG